jgi:hypothetical protein
VVTSDAPLPPGHEINISARSSLVPARSWRPPPSSLPTPYMIVASAAAGQTAPMSRHGFFRDNKYRCTAAFAGGDPVIASFSMAYGATQCGMTPNTSLPTKILLTTLVIPGEDPRRGRRRESSPWRTSETEPVGQAMDPRFRGGDTSRAGRKGLPRTSPLPELVVCVPLGASGRTSQCPAYALSLVGVLATPVRRRPDGKQSPACQTGDCFSSLVATGQDHFLPKCNHHQS